jgi:hypothetical protein
LRARGTVLTAHAAIVNASTAVLSSGKIKFQPALPARHHEAIGKLGLGSYEHVAVEFSGNVLGLRSDDLDGLQAKLRTRPYGAQ